MRTNAIIRIIIFALLALILLAVLVTGISVGLFTFNTASGGTASSSGEVSAADIQRVNIQWASGDITFVPADTDMISFEETGSFSEENAMVWKVTGDELVIQYSKPQKLNFNIGVNLKDVSKDLIVTVPKDWNGSKLTIDCASADMNVQDLTVRSVEFNSASGQGSFTNCNFEVFRVNTASGNFTYSGELTDLEYSGASAKCSLVLTNHPRSMEFDCMSGDMDITLPEDCGFTAEMDSMSGKITTEFATTVSGDKHVYGDGSCQIEADSMSADIIIRKGA